MEDRKVERHAAQSAFMAALAAAAGDDELAQRFADSMVRAHLITRPLDAEVVYDASGLHGAAGEW
jgi:hypothetical protein